jgi:hypothetical protein
MLKLKEPKIYERIIIMVDGKWKDDESEFENCKVVVGDSSDEDYNDTNLFYYFETWKEFKNAFNKNNDDDFVLTNATIDEVI